MNSTGTQVETCKQWQETNISDPRMIEDMNQYFIITREELKKNASRLIGARVRQELDSSDLVQETLLVTVSKLSDLLSKPQSVVFSWMIGVMKHQVQHHVRDLQTHGVTDSLKTPCMDIHTRDCSTQMIFEELRNSLMTELEMMTPCEKQVFQLRYLDSKSLAEISSITGKTEPAVRGLLYRTLMKVKKSLNRIVD